MDAASGMGDGVIRAVSRDPTVTMAAIAGAVNQDVYPNLQFMSFYFS
jgi:hypothetical protein